MKHLNKFSEHQKLNEGGGAGKDFIFENINFNLYFTYKDGKMTEYKKSINLEDSFDLQGYGEGLSGINPEGMFKIELSYDINESQLGDITVGDIQYNVGKELFDGMDENKTLLEISKTQDLDICFEGSSSFSYMHGAGYLTPSISTDSTLLSIDPNQVFDDGYDDHINDVNLYGLLDKKGAVSINIELTPTEKLIGLWDQLIANPPYYQDYVDNYDGDEDEMMNIEEFYNDVNDDLRQQYCY